MNAFERALEFGEPDQPLPITITVDLVIRRWPTNEAPDPLWQPRAVDVVEEIPLNQDFDTGWTITEARPHSFDS